jgi:Thoeris protein ThsA, Macro domain
MLSQLFKQPFSFVIGVVGSFLIVAGFFKIDDISKLAISPLPKAIYLSVIIGVVLLATSIALYAATNLSIATYSISSVKRLSNGFSVSNESFCLNVLFGRIEAMDCGDDDCMVALPTNEFFDQDCMTDPSGALGAYMLHHFKHAIPEMKALIASALQNQPTTEVEKEPGVLVKSYGVGKCVYLDRPLSSAHRIAIVAVTTKRANEGLQADARYLFDAIASLYREMANRRLNKLYIPVMGSGHGGLKGPVSLVCMLIAFTELQRRQSGHHLKNANIVVFRRDDNSTPSVAEKSVKRSLAFASRLLEA